MRPGIIAWNGATFNTVEPEPGVDGRAFIAFLSDGPDHAGVWHYEYAFIIRISITARSILQRAFGMRNHGEQPGGFMLRQMSWILPTMEL